MRILENGVNWAFKAAIGVYVLVALVVGTSMGHKGPVWAVILSLIHISEPTRH